MKYKINAEFTYAEILSLMSLCHKKMADAEDEMGRDGIDLRATVEYFDRLLEKLLNGTDRIDDEAGRQLAAQKEEDA